MRILIVGAGAVGGYFGGRLLAAGRDVTFLVRPARARALASTGLVIRSPAAGDLSLDAPPTVLASALAAPFDLIVLSCKAYDLEDAIASLAPAVGPATAILPLLNGMHHIEMLEERFGAGAVLGGVCEISSTLDSEGRIVHLNDRHMLAFGELSGARSPQTEAVAAAFSGARFEARLSAAILQEMWEKWIFITTLAGINC
ncbi:MAG: 2-dehydropantoate 2-reductase, partial [Acetobacteraceae bacterium]